MTPEQKAWIDGASYETLLMRWRFGKIGDPLFQGDTGDYFAEQMSIKGSRLSHEEKVAISKRIGWER